MILHEDHDGIPIITLLPNRSATWQQTRLFVAAICATTLTIGMALAVIGAWMVLPFSGLEAVLVAYLFYRVCLSTYQRQVITCGTDTITVQFGIHFPKRSWQLERSRTRLSVDAPAHPLDPLKMVIADGTHSNELGHFLNRDDKEQALAALRQAGLPVRHVVEYGLRQV